MPDNDILNAMHLLLASNTFTPARLKTLITDSGYDMNSELMSRLRAIYDCYKKKETLTDESLLDIYKEKQRVSTGRGITNMDMLDFANVLTESESDTYCVHSVVDQLGALICEHYNITLFPEDRIKNAILRSDFGFLHELYDELPLGADESEINSHFRFIQAAQSVLTLTKRSKQRFVTRPGVVLRNTAELEIARAERYSDYALFSLQALCEVLAILFPVFVAAAADYLYPCATFEEFLDDDFPLYEIVDKYIKEARSWYGSVNSDKELLENLESCPDSFCSPDSDPKRVKNINPTNEEDTGNNGSIEIIKKDFPMIAKILYRDFYTE